MTRTPASQVLYQVISLGLLALMGLALIASPSAASRHQDLSPPVAGSNLAEKAGDRSRFRHEGE